MNERKVPGGEIVHFNGFQNGDPEVTNASERGLTREREGADFIPHAQVDVLIIGRGPAGLMLAAQLAVFPEIDAMIVEQKLRPLTETCRPQTATSVGPAILNG